MRYQHQSTASASQIFIGLTDIIQVFMIFLSNSNILLYCNISFQATCYIENKLYFFVLWLLTIKENMLKRRILLRLSIILFYSIILEVYTYFNMSIDTLNSLLFVRRFRFRRLFLSRFLSITLCKLECIVETDFLLHVFGEKKYYIVSTIGIWRRGDLRKNLLVVARLQFHNF